MPGQQLVNKSCLLQKSTSTTVQYVSVSIANLQGVQKLKDGLVWILKSRSCCKTGRNGLYGEEVAAPSNGRACAGVCAFFVLSVACNKQVSWAPVHAQVCRLCRYFWTRD